MADPNLSVFSDDASDASLAEDVSENVAEDIVSGARGNIIANEEHALISTLAYVTGWMHPMTRYVNSTLIGPSSGGKTQVQKFTKSLIPDDMMFSRTSASGQALLESDAWDFALVGPMDEYDKISSDIREFMKSMAGEDEGMSRERTVRDEESDTDFSTAKLESSPIPYQFLYATDNAAKAGIDDELANRMVELYVEDNKFIREAIAKKNHGHEEIDVKGYDRSYIRDTTVLEASIREHIRSLPTLSVEDDGVTDADVGYEGRRGASYVYEPDWVYYVCRPIYNFGRTYTNRVSNQVANLITASTLLNYENRETTEVVRDGSKEEAYVIEPQDVANVLICQPTLLATTHKLDPRKRAILKAVNNQAGVSDNTTEQGWTTLNRVREWLDENDKPTPSESTLRNILKDQLREDWFIEVNDGAGTGGSDLFRPRTDAGIQTPQVKNVAQYAQNLDGKDITVDGIDLSDPFEDCYDPIREQPFLETVEQLDKELAGGSATNETSAGSFMSEGSGSDDGDTEQQATLGGGTSTTDFDDIDGEPEGVIEGTLYEALDDAVDADGEVFNESHSVAHHIGAVDTDVEDVLGADITDTLIDPDHDLWSHATIDEERVTEPTDAIRELSDALTALETKNIVVKDTSDVPPNFFELVVRELDD